MSRHWGAPRWQPKRRPRRRPRWWARLAARPRGRRPRRWARHRHHRLVHLRRRRHLHLLLLGGRAPFGGQLLTATSAIASVIATSALANGSSALANGSSALGRRCAAPWWLRLSALPGEGRIVLSLVALSLIALLLARMLALNRGIFAGAIDLRGGQVDGLHGVELLVHVLVVVGAACCVEQRVQRLLQLGVRRSRIVSRLLAPRA